MVPKSTSSLDRDLQYLEITEKAMKMLTSMVIMGPPRGWSPHREVPRALGFRPCPGPWNSFRYRLDLDARAFARASRSSNHPKQLDFAPRTEIMQVFKLLIRTSSCRNIIYHVVGSAFWNSSSCKTNDAHHLVPTMIRIIISTVISCSQSVNYAPKISTK